MKQLITSVILVSLSIQAFAYNSFDQLCEYNPNWKNYEQRVGKQLAKDITSDVEYIQIHLTQVLELLKTNPTNQLSTEQLTSRKNLLVHLQAYRNAGKFPINYFKSQRIPVFIDENKTHCAVGYLILQSGQEQLALQIAAKNNYAWVKEIKVKELIEWQIASGFTLEELKLIQGAYDSYFENAFYLPNRYEIPQKPEVLVAYFEDSRSKALPKTTENIWCYGEGKNGILNGKWIQNYGVGIPWIEGYYQKGKRTGQWKEYYQGTNLLCRTENWRNDKLNGVRKRFDREGKLVEEILFKNGIAALKTNYDLQGSTKSIRTPLDSNLVYTEIYTLGGGLLAFGNERIHNPGNLLWFQNIELTALNSASITSRDFDQTGSSPFQQTSALYNSPALVEYKKEGDWTFYKEFGDYVNETESTLTETILSGYPHFATEINYSLGALEVVKIKSSLDSINITYDKNLVMNFNGYSSEQPLKYKITYQQRLALADLTMRYSSRRFIDHQPTVSYIVQSIGAINNAEEKIGTWRHFTLFGELYKTENFLIPFKEEEIEIVQN
jgi:hypothetical protein